MRVAIPTEWRKVSSHRTQEGGFPLNTPSRWERPTHVKHFIRLQTFIAAKKRVWFETFLVFIPAQLPPFDQFRLERPFEKFWMIKPQKLPTLPLVRLHASNVDDQHRQLSRARMSQLRELFQPRDVFRRDVSLFQKAEGLINRIDTAPRRFRNTLAALTQTVPVFAPPTTAFAVSLSHETSLLSQPSQRSHHRSAW